MKKSNKQNKSKDEQEIIAPIISEESSEEGEEKEIGVLEEDAIDVIAPEHVTVGAPDEDEEEQYPDDDEDEEENYNPLEDYEDSEKF
jgi:hypothetical protein